MKIILYIAFVSGVAITFFCGWLFGVDYDHRGFDVGFIFMVSLLVGFDSFLIAKSLIS